MIFASLSISQAAEFYYKNFQILPLSSHPGHYMIKFAFLTTTDGSSHLIPLLL